jgi:hypothetical protein
MVVVPSNEAILFFPFRRSAGIVKSQSANENGSFLQSGGTDGDQSSPADSDDGDFVRRARTWNLEWLQCTER